MKVLGCKDNKNFKLNAVFCPTFIIRLYFFVHEKRNSPIPSLPSTHCSPLPIRARPVPHLRHTRFPHPHYMALSCSSLGSFMLIIWHFHVHYMALSSPLFAFFILSTNFSMKNLLLSFFRSIFAPAFLPRKYAYAQMAESVDALVSNTSGAIHPGSIPGLGTL